MKTCPFCCGCHLLLGSRSSALWYSAACVSAAQGFGRDGREMFWHLLPVPVIGGQVLQRSSNQCSGRRRKESLFFFDEKTGRICPSAEFSARAKFTREHGCDTILVVLRGGQVRLRQRHPERSWVLICHCSDGQNRRMGRRGRRTRELAGSTTRSEHVDLYESCCVQRAKTHAKLGSSSQGLLWKLPIVCVTMPLASTCGCRSSFPGSRKYWKPCNMTLKSRA